MEQVHWAGGVHWGRWFALGQVVSMGQVFVRQVVWAPWLWPVLAKERYCFY